MTDRRENPLSSDETKAVVKEALKEWLDEKYSAFGRYTLHGFLALILTGVVAIAVRHDLFK